MTNLTIAKQLAQSTFSRLICNSLISQTGRAFCTYANEPLHPVPGKRTSTVSSEEVVSVVKLITLSDKHGSHSFDTSANTVCAAHKQTKFIIDQVNRHVPRTQDDALVHESNFNTLVKANIPLHELHPENNKSNENEAYQTNDIKLGINSTQQTTATFNTIDLKLIKDLKDHNIPLKHLQPIAIKDVDGLEFKLSDSTMNRNLIGSWMKLSKFRLTSLVVLTTLAGHYMGMVEFSPELMFFTLLGTGLCSSSAAALNQFLEIPYDSQMNRTKSRPLVTHHVTPLHAFIFATVTGVTGFSLLALNVNMLTACLGALNLILYSFIYTPMKRFNILNTWIGSIVGAIPPIMGYTAATGSIDLAAISLGLLLYSWQFPHFNALSWNVKHDYARAGFRMMVVTNPDLCVRTAFRHSWLIALYCELMCTNLVGMNSWMFAFDSLPINLYLIYLAWKFKENPNAKTSRTLFKFSLVHLPVLLTLLLLSKKSKNNSDKDKEMQLKTVS